MKVIRGDTFCGCSTGCKVVVATGKGMALPAAQLVDSFVFDIEGDIDYIELFVRDHVIGRTMRDRRGNLYEVARSKERDALLQQMAADYDDQFPVPGPHPPWRDQR